MSDRVRHKGTPAEPFASANMYGVLNRVAPAGRGTPAMAHVSWGEDGDVFDTWERLSDLTIIRERKRDR